MLIYDYECPACRWSGERLVRSEKRDSQRCEKCKKALKRVVTKAPATGTKFTHQHQTKAVIYQGERKVGHVDGHFGKSAKKRKVP